MLVVFGTDHAGFELKEILKEYVSGLGFDVEDKGAFSYIENDDYPDFVAPVAREVSKDPYFVRGVVLGGSGQGEAMVANRSPNVRAAVFIKPASIEGGEGADDVIRLSREHNDSNVLSLGAKFLTEEEAKGAVKKWLETPFSGEERHKRRIRKIDESVDQGE